MKDHILVYDEGMSTREYLERMFECTSKTGELLIARYEDELVYITAESVERATYVERYQISWKEKDVDKVHADYLGFIDKISDKTNVDWEEDLPDGQFVAYLKSYTVKIRKLIESNAPKMVIANEIKTCIDAFALNAFGISCEKIEYLNKK